MLSDRSLPTVDEPHAGRANARKHHGLAAELPPPTTTTSCPLQARPQALWLHSRDLRPWKRSSSDTPSLRVARAPVAITTVPPRSAVPSSRVTSKKPERVLGRSFLRVAGTATARRT